MSISRVDFSLSAESFIYQKISIVDKLVHMAYGSSIWWEVLAGPGRLRAVRIVESELSGFVGDAVDDVLAHRIKQEE